jgi:hydroxyacylglutathione hydrolase
MLLTGDLLFVGDIGRPDLPGAEILDEQVENLYHSLYTSSCPISLIIWRYFRPMEKALCAVAA